MSQSIQKQVNRLRNIIDTGKINESLCDFKTHIARHINQSDVTLLEETLNGKLQNSVFLNASDLEYLISEALYYHSENIVNWADTAYNGEKCEFTTNMDEYDTVVGHGYILDTETNTIKDYETNNLCLVMQKDNTMELGFRILTAYPDMRNADITATNKDLQEITKQTEQYKTANPVKQAYLLYCTDPKNNLRTSYSPGHYEEDAMLFLHVPTKNPNTKHIIRLTEDATTMMTVHEKSKIETKYTKLNQELQTNHHKNTFVVDLTNPTLHDSFKKDYPSITTTVDTLQTFIKSAKDNRDEQKKSTKINRLQQANKLLENIKEPDDTEDKYEY